MSNVSPVVISTQPELPNVVQQGENDFDKVLPQCTLITSIITTGICLGVCLFIPGLICMVPAVVLSAIVSQLYYIYIIIIDSIIIII